MGVGTEEIVGIMVLRPGEDVAGGSDVLVGVTKSVRLMLLV